jgi:hypothetical protein
MYDALAALRDAGCPVDQLSTAQRAVLETLTEPETTMLVSLQLRLRLAEGEVTAHELKLL